MESNSGIYGIKLKSLMDPNLLIFLKLFLCLPNIILKIFSSHLLDLFKKINSYNIDIKV